MDYVALQDTRDANNYEFYWGFEAILYATDYWPWVNDADGNSQSIDFEGFEAIENANILKDSLSTLQTEWNSVIDIGFYVQGPHERVLFTSDENTAISSIMGIPDILESTEGKTDDEKTALFQSAYSLAKEAQDEIAAIIPKIEVPFQRFNILDNVANLKTITKFLESGFANIDANDTDGKELIELVTLIEDSYEAMSNVKTLFDLTYTDFNEFIGYIDAQSTDELKVTIQRGEKSDEPLVAYVGEPFSFKAHMDYLLLTYYDAKTLLWIPSWTKYGMICLKSRWMLSQIICHPSCKSARISCNI